MNQHPYPTGKYDPTCNCASCAVAERDELRAKLAALEAQKPVAHVEYFSLSRNAFCVDFHDGYKPLDKTKLYLAAGAKESNHG